jgi:hypothetical protein
MSIYNPRARIGKGRFRTHINALVEDRRRSGIEQVVKHSNRGHIRLEWRVQDQKQVYFTSATIFNWRSTLNARAAFRRKLQGPA